MASPDELAEACRSGRVGFLVAFGSATHPEGSPRDLDVAVRFDSEHGDLLRLQALVGCAVLFERAPGLVARAQMAA